MTVSVLSREYTYLFVVAKKAAKNKSVKLIQSVARQVESYQRKALNTRRNIHTYEAPFNQCINPCSVCCYHKKLLCTTFPTRMEIFPKSDDGIMDIKQNNFWDRKRMSAHFTIFCQSAMPVQHVCWNQSPRSEERNVNNQSDQFQRIPANLSVISVVFAYYRLPMGTCNLLHRVMQLMMWMEGEEFVQ